MNESISLTVDSTHRVQILRPDGFSRVVYENYESDNSMIVDLTVSPEGEIYLVEAITGQDLYRNRLLHATSINDAFSEIPIEENIIKLDAGSDGTLYAVTESFRVVKIGQSGTLENVSEEDFAQEISVGADGTVWVVGRSTNTDENVGGNHVHYYENETWTALPDEVLAQKVTGDIDGDVYVIKSDGNVAQLDKQGKAKTESDFDYRHIAREISVGPAGALWMITSQPTRGGNYIMLSTDEGQTWADVPKFGAIRLDAGKFNQ